MTLSPGSRLGPYEIAGLIGAGGMGEVYRAVDPRLGRDVAIKVLPPAFARDPERLRRFEQEARAAGILNHPNILAIHDIGAHEGAPYVVSELLEGETLRDRVRGGPLPQRKAIEVALQIASGLAAAHDKGIVHRDLKPENVFLTKDGRVKILDFGLAKLSRPAGDIGETSSAMTTADTMPGAVLGTAGYMSPEQVRGLPVDHHSDVFSFGAILYEMLSGQRAFDRDSAVETMNAILKEDPPDLIDSGRVPLPPGLERIVGRCLEKRPEDRFRSAHDLAFALDALSGMSSVTSIEGAALAGESAASGAAGAGAGPTGGVRATRRAPMSSLRKLLIGAWAALMALLLVFLVGRLSHRSAAPQVATLTVRATPARARVTLGERMLRGPVAAFDSLAAGAYTLRVELDGYTTITRQVVVEPGVAREESVALVAAAAGPREALRDADRAAARARANARTGSLRVFAGTHSLDVVLDGQPTGRRTPCVISDLAPGAHSVHVRGSGFDVRGDPRSVAVVAGDTTDINFGRQVVPKKKSR